MLKNLLSKIRVGLIILIGGTFILSLLYDYYTRAHNITLPHIVSVILILLLLISWELLYQNKINELFPYIPHRKQKKALKSLTPDQKITLLDFLNKDCRTIGNSEKSTAKEIIQAGILYRNENIDGVNVYCINKYSQKYLLKHNKLLSR